MFKRIVVAFCLGAVTLGVDSNWVHSDANPGAQDIYSRLRERYKKYWSSMYLMYSTLRNMRSALNDPDKYKETIKEHPKAQIDVLRNFLANNLYRKDPEGNISYLNSLSFLQLNMASWEAGYKYNTDDLPQISTLAWSEKEVKEISVYADAYRSSNQEVAAKTKAISSGTLTIANSWETLDKAKTNPYLSNEGFASMLTEFHQRVERNPKELDAIKSEKPEMFKAIKAFHKQTNDRIIEMENSRTDKGFFDLLDATSPAKIKRASEVETTVNQFVLDAFLDSRDTKGIRPKLTPSPSFRPVVDVEKKEPIYMLFQIRNR
jgi:hypothetical protein